MVLTPRNTQCSHDVRVRTELVEASLDLSVNQPWQVSIEGADIVVD
jgi:hypothetical protein